MDCPKCSGPTRVYGTANVGGFRRRYRRCKQCDHRFISLEQRVAGRVTPHSKRGHEAASGGISPRAHAASNDSGPSDASSSNNGPSNTKQRSPDLLTPLEDTAQD